MTNREGSTWSLYTEPKLLCLTQKCPAFYTNTCFRTVYAKKNALLFVKNLWCTENTLPAAWFSELLSECLTFCHKWGDFDEINASLFRNKEILNMHSIFELVCRVVCIGSPLYGVL